MTIAAIKLLLEHEADPNAQMKDGSTALHILAIRLDKDDEGAILAAVGLLLERGTDPDTQDEDGATVLHCLVEQL